MNRLKYNIDHRLSSLRMSVLTQSKVNENFSEKYEWYIRLPCTNIPVIILDDMAQLYSKVVLGIDVDKCVTNVFRI